MAAAGVPLREFVRCHNLPQQAHVVSGYGAGECVTVVSTERIKIVEVEQKRGDPAPVELPLDYDAGFELIVTTPNAPWAGYKEYKSVADLASAPPLAVRALRSWRGADETDSVYENDILANPTMTSRGLKVVVRASLINRHVETFVELAFDVVVPFTTDLRGHDFRLADLALHFANHFPIKAKVHTPPSPRCAAATPAVAVTGSTWQFLAVRDRLAVQLFRERDQQSFLFDADAEIRVRLANDDDFDEPVGDYVNAGFEPVTDYINAETVAAIRGPLLPLPPQSYPIDDDDYTSMLENPVGELRKMLSEKTSVIEKLNKQLQSYEFQLTNSEQEMTQLQAQLDENGHELIRKTEEVNAIRGELKGVEQERDHCANNLLTAEQRIGQLRTQLDALESQRQQQVKRLQEDVCQLTTELERYQTEESTKMADELQEEFEKDRLKADKRKAEEKVVELTERLKGCTCSVVKEDANKKSKPSSSEPPSVRPRQKKHSSPQPPPRRRPPPTTPLSPAPPASSVAPPPPPPRKDAPALQDGSSSPRPTPRPRKQDLGPSPRPMPRPRENNS